MSAVLLAVQTSDYQMFKIRLLQAVPLTKDAVHVYVGMVCLLLALIVLRQSPRSFRALVPGLVVALGMEVFDLRDDLVTVGHYRWAASLKDLVNTNLLPLVFVLAHRAGLVKR